eukprot:TRINITY_DN7135_c0_g1_i2.p1 TRINITY_DN7135_c0_g1~~TRINITY_DN7135_c0_g1_i2.p1  ORF type:complete len:203 (+),score=30.84 TRINITY_DN7135_c0_g1_i2:48-611(+)
MLYDVLAVYVIQPQTLDILGSTCKVMHEITRDDTLWTIHYNRNFEQSSDSSTSTTTTSSSLAPISYYSSFSDQVPSSSKMITIRQRYIHRHLLKTKFSTQYNQDRDIYDLIKMMLVGPSGSGKSSFRFRFDQEDIREAHVPTIGAEFSVRSLWYRGNVVKMQLWDLASHLFVFVLIRRIYVRPMSPP